MRKISKSSAAAKKGEIVPGAATAALWRAARTESHHRNKARSRIIDIVVDSGKKDGVASASTPPKAKIVKWKGKPKDEVDSLGDVFRNMLVDHLKGK
jgi:hypothetical protein